MHDEPVVLEGVENVSEIVAKESVEPASSLRLGSVEKRSSAGSYAEVCKQAFSDEAVWSLVLFH